jgi:hypothetical protein
MVTFANSQKVEMMLGAMNDFLIYFSISYRSLLIHQFQVTSPRILIFTLFRYVLHRVLINTLFS